MQINESKYHYWAESHTCQLIPAFPCHTLQYCFTCRWVGGLFRQGYQKGLEDVDIYDVLPDDSSIKLSANLGKYVSDRQ